MPSTDINSVNLTGRLTHDPTTQSFSSGASVCRLRLAYKTSRKQDGERFPKPNYISVEVWGKAGQACAEHLSSGSQIAVTGRLEWREWVHEDTKHQATELIADNVVFLARAPTRDAGGPPADLGTPGVSAAANDVPVEA